MKLEWRVRPGQLKWLRDKSDLGDVDRAVERADKIRMTILFALFVSRSRRWLTIRELTEYVMTQREFSAYDVARRYTRRLLYSLEAAGFVEVAAGPAGVNGKWIRGGDQ